MGSSEDSASVAYTITNTASSSHKTSCTLVFGGSSGGPWIVFLTTPSGVTCKSVPCWVPQTICFPFRLQQTVQVNEQLKNIRAVTPWRGNCDTCPACVMVCTEPSEDKTAQSSNMNSGLGLKSIKVALGETWTLINGCAAFL